MPSESNWAQFNKEEAKKKIFFGVIAALRTPARFLGLFGSQYERDFSSVEPGKQDRPFLLPQEVRDADEPEVIQKLRDIFVEDTTKNEKNPKGIARDGDALKVGFQDPHWGHSTGNLRGKLEIDPSGLPFPDHHAELRVGLFEAPGTYEVYCRPNFLYDPGLPIAINRMSLKLKMPKPYTNACEEESEDLDLLLSEGIPLRSPDAASDEAPEGDGQGFFFRDARQLLMASILKDRKMHLGRILASKGDAAVIRNWKENIFTSNTDSLYKEDQASLAWHDRHYYSAGPYALGTAAMKFALVPEAPEAGEEVEIFATRDMNLQPFDAITHPAKDHAKAFRALSENERTLRFKLMVQIATEDSITTPAEPGHPPKAVMAAEYTDIAWDTRHAPFHQVGTLSLEPHDVDPADASNGWHALPFNAWNTYPENRPLGQLFRARRVVHEEHWKARLTHSFNESDPYTVPKGRCPFSGA